MSRSLPGSVFADYQNRINSGAISALEAQGQLATLNSSLGGWTLTPDQEKWLDNMIASQNTQSARDWERENAKNSTLWLADQLNSLGLSSQGVTSMGSNLPNAVAAADNVKTNISNAKADRQNALARSMLSMVGSMASAGIYGGAIASARKAAASVATNASKAMTSASMREQFIRDTWKAEAIRQYNKMKGIE